MRWHLAPCFWSKKRGLYQQGMSPQGEGVPSGVCSKQGLPASQAAAPAGGAGQQMDGRAMVQRQPGRKGKGGERWARSTSLPHPLALLCQFSFHGGGEQGSGAQRSVPHHKMIKTTEVFISFPVTVDVTAIAIFWDKLFISGFSSFISCSQRKNWWGVVIIYITAGDGDFNSDIQNRCIVLLYKKYMW